MYNKYLKWRMLMAIRIIRKNEDPALYKTCKEVKKFDARLSELIDDMIETMNDADGVGLAAPQIGVSQRVVIVDGDVVADTYDYLKDFRRTLINPEILEESEEQTTYSEGCLSIPGVYCDIVRPKTIKVRYYNEDLEQVTEVFDNFASRMVQHELSHLDGDLFTDHAAPIRKKMLSSKLQNISKGKVHPHYNTKLR